MEFILIDGSYFIYHRYYSLKNWWNKAKRPDESDIPFENDRFIEKYNTTFPKKIKDIVKTYSVSKSPIVLVAKDCSSRTIWRRELFPEYKHGRKVDDKGVGDSFKKTYKEDLFTKSGIHALLYEDKLEADDCIAITVKHLKDKYPTSRIVIITSDMDYLQLASSQVEIYNLNKKALCDSPHSFNDSKKDLFCKIVAGDKSDNIAAVFPRCGPKTAAKYYHDQDDFFRRLSNDPVAHKRYILNKTLIDFNEIPHNLAEKFRKQCLKL